MYTQFKQFNECIIHEGSKKTFVIYFCEEWMMRRWKWTETSILSSYYQFIVILRWRFVWLNHYQKSQKVSNTCENTMQDI